MPRFRYRAARPDGSLHPGAGDADAVSALAAQLSARGLTLIDATVAPERVRRQAPSRDLAVVFQSLASLVAAGLPLERALGATAALAEGRLHTLLHDARRQLHEGRTLSESLAANPGLVPGVVLGMLRAGEHGSQLESALDEAARHFEREAELAAHVRHALAYPMLLGVACIVTVVVLVTTVIPRFAELLTGLDVALPAATRMLLGLSALTDRFGVLVAVGGVAVAAGLAEWRRRPAGALAWEELLLRLPLIGRIRLALATSRICRALGGMLRAGLPLLQGLEFGREAAGNLAVAARLDQAREEIRQGSAMTPALSRAAAMTPTALQLVSVGESSGQLAAMLSRAGDLSGQEAERGLRTLAGLLEPSLIVVFGGLVAFVAAALLQAVYAVRAV